MYLYNSPVFSEASNIHLSVIHRVPTLLCGKVWWSWRGQVWVTACIFHGNGIWLLAGDQFFLWSVDANVEQNYFSTTASITLLTKLEIIITVWVYWPDAFTCYPKTGRAVSTISRVGMIQVISDINLKK